MTTISTSPPSCASDDVARRLRRGPAADRASRGRPHPGAGGRRDQGFRARRRPRAARQAGLRDLGENYAAELVAKAPAVDDAVVWHFLGAVQRNKVPLLAPLVGLWQSVAREAEAARIARFSAWSQGPGAGRDDRPAGSQRMPAVGGARTGGAPGRAGARRQGPHDGGGAGLTGRRAGRLRVRGSLGRPIGARGALDGHERRPRGGGGGRVDHGPGRSGPLRRANGRLSWGPRRNLWWSPS